MMSGPTRREFMAASSQLLGSAWVWLNVPAVSALAGCARDAARAGAPFEVLTAAEAATMRAFAARIIPSDGELPGAEEAGAVYFADRGLGGFFSGMQPLIRAGLADLDTRAGQRGGAFAELSPSDQDAVMREVESTPFFGSARMLVVLGTFADPSHGGNRDGAGMKILRVDHQPSYQPPFGYYDGEAMRGGGA
jgi:hypothetical protein